jgi:hypothetical protein
MGHVVFALLRIDITVNEYQYHIKHLWNTHRLEQSLQVSPIDTCAYNLSNSLDTAGKS